MTDPGPLMQAEFEDGRVLVRLSGEVDLSNVEGLEAQIEDTIADARDVVIDLTAIEFIDSRGLRLLNRVASSVAATRRNARRRGSAELRRPERARHDGNEPGTDGPRLALAVVAWLEQCRGAPR